jgi:hypothetical protein
MWESVTNKMAISYVSLVCIQYSHIRDTPTQCSGIALNISDLFPPYHGYGFGSLFRGSNICNSQGHALTQN